MTQEYTLDRPVALSCPECGGVVSPQSTGTLLQFRCHIGHVLTAEAMLAAQFATLEYKLSACLACLNERADLCRQMSEAAVAEGQDPASLQVVQREAIERAQVIKGLLESEWSDSVRDLPGLT